MKKQFKAHGIGRVTYSVEFELLLFIYTKLLVFDSQTYRFPPIQSLHRQISHKALQT